MKIAYLGYDIFISCFDTLLAEKHEIVKVFSYKADNVQNFNTELKSKSDALGIPFTEEPIPASDIELLAASGCTLLFSAGYPYKIPVPQEPMRAVNIHPTLLPEGRGVWPLPWIILKGISESGVTIHKISEKWDQGDILLQEKFEVRDTETLESLTAKIQVAAARLTVELVPAFGGFWTHATPQIGGSYWKQPTEKDWSIDWHMPVSQIDKIVRAFGNFDSTAIIDGRHLLVQAASYRQENHAHIPVPGTVIERSENDMTIAAKDGFVRLTGYKDDPDFDLPQKMKV